jgi:hypothetical protein
LKSEIADYILCLSESLAHTRQANDRPLYDKYLADAAVLLALAEKGADVTELKQRIEIHERLLSNSWLIGDEYQEIYKKWKAVKNLV